MSVQQMSLGDSLLLSVVGILFVFLILAFLAVVVVVMAKLVTSFHKKSVPEPKANTPISTAITPAPVPMGSIFGGNVKLFDVDDQTAALIMAIVANNSDIPLNELVFKSIRAL